MFNNILVHFGYILEIEIIFDTSFFGILNVSGFIGYSFKFGFGSDNIHYPKYNKTRSIRYLCRVRIGSDSFSSDRVWFGFSGSVYLSSPSSYDLLKFFSSLPHQISLYIYFKTSIFRNGKNCFDLGPIILIGP